MMKRIAIVSVAAALLIGGCGSAKLPSLTTGSVSTPAKPAVPVDDPVARGVEVGVTSAQAEKCGYFFDPQQLRASFLAAEAQRATSPDVLRKVETAHDFARLRVARQIAKAGGYCSAGKTAEIKTNLTRYLAGDFSRKKQAQVATTSGLDIFGNQIRKEEFNMKSIHDPLLHEKTKKVEE